MMNDNHTPVSWFRMTELDRINAPELAARIAEAEAEQLQGKPRSYPGYPTWQLPVAKPRWSPSFDAVLKRRRCHHKLASAFPGEATLGRLLQCAHGITGELYRGPVPSAGGLQALEVFLVHWQDAWLPGGAYHYDRGGHCLSQVRAGAEESGWRQRFPSLHQFSGGALLWILVGDTRLVTRKYGERGERFLLLEAGHLMQNLCLVSESLGQRTVPLGGYMERDIAKELRLLNDDLVLYAAVCGEAVRER